MEWNVEHYCCLWIELPLPGVVKKTVKEKMFSQINIIDCIEKQLTKMTCPKLCADIHYPVNSPLVVALLK